MALIEHFAPLFAISIVIGTLIGITGIGGVLMLPSVLATTALPVDVAVKICLGAFFFTGLAGSSRIYLGRTPRRLPSGLLAGALGGALVGVVLADHMSGEISLAGLAALALVSGLMAFRPARGAAGPGHSRHVAPAPLGAAVGLGSALTGTGGPVLLTPLLILVGRPPREIVAESQVVQLPIGLVGLCSAFAVGAGAGFAAVVLGGVLALGAFVGGRMGERIDDGLLRRMLGAILLAYGVLQMSSLLGAG